ncbi:D-ribose transporter ATP-binding protein [Paenibacillus sp. 32O-W]|uniref:sugar ABC transporter ATP-binding protein n=1 Tax=Paenibacillus sp. 32O-W TaxID=1695218 RepID=UPI0007215066|nr:sugar ABC transporter ATP-binding protein [Paenibacillus sp. 32O-W]ALS28578.1 D-ribose transporter ATP-binding protein [Paenibacillus sp. 32O-W]
MSAERLRHTDEICMQARQVSKIYPGTVALNKVDFNVYRGKVNVLIGENGAGKSTLMKILAGIERPTEGEIVLFGESIRLHNTREAAAKGIGIIHQELNLFPNLTVAQNIFMAREETKFGGAMLDQGKHIEKAKRILEMLEHPIDPRTLVSNLKVGQQQIVEIAKTMAQQDLHVLIMDEPTSSLSNAEVEVLFKLINDLKSKGISIIYISHRLEEIMRIGDYITVLRDGHLVAEDLVSNIDIPWIVRHMVGHDQTKMVAKSEKKFSEEVLRVESLTLPRPGGGYYLDQVSFKLHKGEVLGIYGLLGAGRTELIETLMGLHPEAKGDIYLEGKKIKPESVWKQIRRGFALIPEDRQREGLVQALSIAKNMTLSSLKNYTKLFHISEDLENKSVNRMIKELFIKAPDPKLPILSLSGGNQQKVVIGKGMLTSPKIMLMDEPSRGIDVGAKADVYKIVDQLAAQGLSIILVVSELKEIIAISDRVLVLSGGKLTGEFIGSDITEENLVQASFSSRKAERSDSKGVHEA